MASRGASALSKSRRDANRVPATDTLVSSDPLGSLPPTAVRILKAARRLVAKQGYHALSLQAVANEAGVLKSTIAYHFGDKAGLVSSLTESLIHDVNTSVVHSLDSIPPGHERLHQLLIAQRQTAEATAYWRLLFALAPEIAKDKKLRTRFEALMNWYYEVVLRGLGIWREGEDNEAGRLLVSLFLAVLEGLALQRQLFPGTSDLDAQFALWESIITPHLDRVLAQSRSGSDHEDRAALLTPETSI